MESCALFRECKIYLLMGRFVSTLGGVLYIFILKIFYMGRFYLYVLVCPEFRPGMGKFLAVGEFALEPKYRRLGETFLPKPP